MVALGLFFFRAARDRTASPPVVTNTPVLAPETEAWKLAQRAKKVIEGVGRERLETADELCKKALELDPLDGRIFAIAAVVDVGWVYSQMDKSEARLQQAKNHMARAAVLAPGDPWVRFAQAQVFAWVIGTPAMTAEAEKLLRGLKDDPMIGHDTQVMLGTLVRDLGRPGEAAVIFEQIGDLASAGWAYLNAGKNNEVLRVADAQLALGYNEGALRQKIYAMESGEDLPAVVAVVRQFTPESLLNDGPALIATNVALAQRDAARVLEIASAFPHDTFSGPGFFAPKRFFTGWAHRLAGRPEVALAEWRAALSTVQDQLKGRPNDPDLLGWRAVLQAWLGDELGSRESMRLCLSLMREPSSVAFRNQLVVDVALGRKEAAIQRLLTSDLKKEDRLKLHSGLRFSPLFDALRGDPRFEKYLRDTQPPGAKPFEEPAPAASATAAADKEFKP